MTPSHPSANYKTSHSRPLLWVLAWAIITVYFLAPPNAAMNATLDSSNYGSYAWMTKHGKQFGTGVIAMTGPFGFLAYGTTYTGELSDARWIGDILLKGLVAFLVLQLATQVTGLRRWLWLGVILIFLPNVPDLFPDFAILVAGLCLLTGPRRAASHPVTLLAAGLLGFMALMKGTNALVAGAALTSVMIQAFLEKRARFAAANALIAVGVFLAGWLLAGQKTTHAPAYFRGVWELATGYNETMGLGSSRRDLASGLILAGGILSLYATIAWPMRRNPGRALVVLFLAGFAFLKWKHGFVRADGHVFIFFNYALLALGAGWLVAPVDLARPTRNLAILATLGVLAVGTIAASDFRFRRFSGMFSDLPAMVSRNATWLFSPQKVHAEWEQTLAQNRVTTDLPQIRDEIENKTVDFFGYEEGVLLLNRFNYRPRPMGGGSFNVFTRYLQEKNDAFIRDAARPEYQLVKLQTLDDRLPAADDPLTLIALLQLYAPIRAQRDYLLFEQQPGAKAYRPRVLSTITARSGEPVALPAINDHDLLLFSVAAPYSLAGRINGAVYRPPVLHVELQADGVHTFRLAPAMATVPVLLSPLIENNRDLLTLYGAGTPRRVTQLTFKPDHGFTGEFKVTFYTVPSLPAPPDNMALELLTYLQYPLANRTPSGIVTAETGIHELYEEPVTLVHAPGELVFPLSAGDQQIIFNYGLMPQAYDPGRTKGVNFFVEVVGVNGATTSLFSRFLDPVLKPADRGMQWIRVFLPPIISPGQLRLRTAPGPTGDAGWAQSYFTHVQIKPGSIDPRQFSGFNVAPLPPGFEKNEEHQAYGRTVRAFHPPASLSFPIPEHALTVTVAAGIQAVAYEGENQCNGMEFILSVESPEKAPVILSQRFLDPLHHAKDRGTQTFCLTLPADLPKESRLVVRAGPGPANDDRWDWGYLETVYFR